LALASFARIGIKLPHQSGAISRLGRRVTSLQPGDLLFLADRSGVVYHVIVYIGNNQIVEAAGVGIGVVKGQVYPYSFAERFI
jgi:cell wall-associated NlpC family hydrolase